MARFRCTFALTGAAVALEGTYDPPPAKGMYGHFRVERGHVLAASPLQFADASGIEGHSLDAIVSRATSRVGRATW